MHKNHWVTHRYDGKDAILHKDCLYKSLTGVDQEELVFPQDTVQFWKFNKNVNHQLSRELKQLIENMGNSFERNPNFLVTKFKYFNDEHTWKGLLASNTIV